MPARIRNRRRPQLIALLLLAALLIGGWYLEERFLAPPGWQRPLGQITSGDYVVQRVVDGDTIVLEKDRLRVRLQGVDTPEMVQENGATQSWGPEATEYTLQFLKKANWRVRLVIDGETVDRYGRQLAFVWHEGRLLNEELLQQGLAHAKTGFDFSRAMKDRLLQAQSEAQESLRGIWSPSQIQADQ
ncbi:MAG: thermonuclease family protein [Bythopirellula sp.]